MPTCVGLLITKIHTEKSKSQKPDGLDQQCACVDSRENTCGKSQAPITEAEHPPEFL